MSRLLGNLETKEKKNPRVNTAYVFRNLGLIIKSPTQILEIKKIFFFVFYFNSGLFYHSIANIKTFIVFAPLLVLVWLIPLENTQRSYSFI